MVMCPLKLPSGNCASTFTGLICTWVLDAHVTNVLIAAFVNATKHTVEWTMLPCDIPFDVLFADVWSPDAIPRRNGDCKGLNVMKGMSGFIDGSPLAVVDSTTVAQSMYQQVFSKFGLPHLLVVDAGSEFRSTLEAVDEFLCIKIILLPP
jgi:hypothetical protein